MATQLHTSTCGARCMAGKAELPKKIVGEVEKNFTEYLPLKDKTGAGFYCRLNAILKKYGGEDE